MYSSHAASRSASPNEMFAVATPTFTRTVSKWNRRNQSWRPVPPPAGSPRTRSLRRMLFMAANAKYTPPCLTPHPTLPILVWRRTLFWRGGREDEGGCLENSFAVTLQRGFESRPLRFFLCSRSGFGWPVESVCRVPALPAYQAFWRFAFRHGVPACAESVPCMTLAIQLLGG